MNQSFRNYLESNTISYSFDYNVKIKSKVKVLNKLVWP